jgi:hypothetical protein
MKNLILKLAVATVATLAVSPAHGGMGPGEGGGGRTFPPKPNVYPTETQVEESLSTIKQMAKAIVYGLNTRYCSTVDGSGNAVSTCDLAIAQDILTRDHEVTAKHIDEVVITPIKNDFCYIYKNGVKTPVPASANGKFFCFSIPALTQTEIQQTPAALDRTMVALFIHELVHKMAGTDEKTERLCQAIQLEIQHSEVDDITFGWIFDLVGSPRNGGGGIADALRYSVERFDFSIKAVEAMLNDLGARRILALDVCSQLPELRPEYAFRRDPHLPLSKKLGWVKMRLEQRLNFMTHGLCRGNRRKYEAYFQGKRQISELAMSKYIGAISDKFSGTDKDIIFGDDEPSVHRYQSDSSSPLSSAEIQFRYIRRGNLTSMPQELTDLKNDMILVRDAYRNY